LVVLYGAGHGSFPRYGRLLLFDLHAGTYNRPCDAERFTETELKE
jgi:hypothetical protein